MYNEQQYKKDVEFIERMDKKISREIAFLLYFCAFIACLAAHVLYLVLFSLAGIKSMAIFNIFSVCFYAVLIFLSRKVKDNLNLVYISMIEIAIHAAAATVCVGLKPDFCMFLLMIIPLAFLVPNKNRYLPFIVLFVTVPLYGVLRFLYLVPGKELYDISDNSYMTVLYMINIFIGSFVLIYVAVIFTVMHRYYDCKLRVQTEQLRVMASTDPLTKLNNRRVMTGKLSEVSMKSTDSGSGYIIGIGDIDDFKKVNDTYGHDIGGEEFLFVLPDMPLSEARRLGEDMIKEVSQKQFIANDKTFSVTMTLVLCEGQPGDNIEKVISRADSRLYNGKHSGKNRVEYEN